MNKAKQIAEAVDKRFAVLTHHKDKTPAIETLTNLIQAILDDGEEAVGIVSLNQVEGEPAYPAITLFDGYKNYIGLVYTFPQSQVDEVVAWLEKRKYILGTDLEYFTKQIMNNKRDNTKDKIKLVDEILTKLKGTNNED